MSYLILIIRWVTLLNCPFKRHAWIFCPLWVRFAIKGTGCSRSERGDGMVGGWQPNLKYNACTQRPPPSNHPKLPVPMPTSQAPPSAPPQLADDKAITNESQELPSTVLSAWPQSSIRHKAKYWIGRKIFIRPPSPPSINQGNSDPRNLEIHPMKNQHWGKKREIPKKINDQSKIGLSPNALSPLSVTASPLVVSRDISVNGDNG